MKLVGLGNLHTEAAKAGPIQMRQLRADGKALVALSKQYLELAKVTGNFSELRPQLQSLAQAIEPKLAEATVTTATDYKALMELVQHVATSQYSIEQATRRAFERKMGPFEAHRFDNNRLDGPEGVAELLTVLADGDQKTHGAVWNNLLFAKPGETVWQIMERDRQVSDAAARHSALLDTLASMLAELSQKTRPPEVKVRSRGEKALVTAVKASDASPVFAAVEIAKTPVEAETLARWAKNAPEALGGPQTQRALEVMRRNFAMMAARTNRTDLWSEQMLDRELGPNAKG